MMHIGGLLSDASGSVKFIQTPTSEMIADIFTKALPKPAHIKHMNTLLSDLPKKIVDMTLSADSEATDPENLAVEKEDCKPALEGLPEFEGSPLPKDDSDRSSRVLEYACMGTVGLGREFQNILMEAIGDG